MDFVYEVKHRGFYINIEDAVKIGRGNFSDIYKVYINKSDNFKEKYLEHKTYGNFHYYIYTNLTFYDPQDALRIEEEQNILINERNKLFEKRKTMKYNEIPKLGWCDYPEQFVEKCPYFNGTVKFYKLTRETHPDYPISEYRDYSSKYYVAKYIGNYDIEYTNTKFSFYDGKKSNIHGIPYPKIDEIWEFETDRYPFGEFIFTPTMIKKINCGRLLD